MGFLSRFSKVGYVENYGQTLLLKNGTNIFAKRATLIEMHYLKKAHNNN